MRYVMSALVVLVACSSPASALELLVRIDPQSQRDSELLSLLAQRQQAGAVVGVLKPVLVAQPQQAAVIKPVQVDNLVAIQKQQEKVRLVLPQQQVKVLRGFRFGRRVWPRQPRIDAAKLKPCITHLMQAIKESNTEVLASAWDIQSARFVDVRNGTIVSQHSLKGKDDGRIKRLARLIRTERLADWLNSPAPVTTTADGKSALLHLRNEKRGPILDATSLHLKQKGDGTWVVVALVHSIRGA